MKKNATREKIKLGEKFIICMRKKVPFLLIVAVMLSSVFCQTVCAEDGFTVAGYIKPDFVYEIDKAADILSDFDVTIDGTQISGKTDSRGYFELKNVQSSNSSYTIKISKNGYLTRQIRNIKVSENVFLSEGDLPIEIWVGDFNGNFSINLEDIMYQVKAFNSVPSDARYNLIYDIDRDDSINLLDIILLTKHYNAVSSDYPSEITCKVVQSSTPTKTPTATPTPTVEPTPSPTPTPTSTPTVEPTPSPTTIPTTIPTPTPTLTPTPTPTAVPSVQPTLDAMNYVSDTKSIHIMKYEQGTGEDKITYFVADVKISKGSDIQSAFAKDTYGLHITEKTTKIAKRHDAIFAVNGSYYGFREDGIEIRNGVLYRDVPFRTGLIINNDGIMQSYDEKSASSAEMLENGVYQAISFGPVLVKSGTLMTDFKNTVIDVNSSSAAARRPIEEANPRTGIGMIEANHFVFIVVDGRNPGYSRGATLAEFAKMFYDLGCKEAYNLDGGASSTMYFNGNIVNVPSLGKERSISDILYITK